ncbi:hypothetical protein [Bosea sp. TAF32]|uniref:hypothetical protein n=1 Tax=Bosea sp. TAF32 TaxID=3237482 RepID=UPI003F8DFA1C
MHFDRATLEHAQAEVDAITVQIVELEQEAAGSSDPAVFVPVIAVLEAERDVALPIIALERAKQRLAEALAALG